VTEADHLGGGLAGCVVNAGVAVAVDQDDIFRPAERADERQVRLVTGTEDDRVTLAEPRGQLTLQILVESQCAVGRPRSGRAGAVLDHGLAGRRDDLGMQREAEVIVRPEHQRGPPLDDDLAGTEHTVDDRLSRPRPTVGESRASHVYRAQFVQQIHQPFRPRSSLSP
jgi:hypothetical protein